MHKGSTDARLLETLDPFPFYARMRRQAPVAPRPPEGVPAFFHARGGGCMVFGYDDAKRVLSDPGIFSARREEPKEENLFSITLSNTDPPRHGQLRSLVNRAFTSRHVEALAPRIAEICEELTGSFRGESRVDFAREFAGPMPTIVIAELLGIPPSDRDDFRRWADATLAFDPTGIREMAAYFERIIDKRENEPGGDDLVSLLLAARVEGESFNHRDLLGFCMLLLVAGSETTTNMLSNTLLSFRDFPEELERVKADPTLLPGVVEESLRYRSPVQLLARLTTTETEIGGHTVPAGQTVWLFVGSANRDEARFEDAERFDVTRSPNRHMAFGQGNHFCLGAPLARLEATIALEHLLENLPDIRVAEDAHLERIPNQHVYGPISLPVLI